jgi:hypothetical protein
MGPPGVQTGGRYQGKFAHTLGGTTDMLQLLIGFGEFKVIERPIFGW